MSMQASDMSLVIRTYRKIIRNQNIWAVICCLSTLFMIIPIGFAEVGQTSTSASNVEQVVNEGEARVKEGKKAQDKIDKLGDKISDYSTEYQQTLKVIDGLKVYNGLIQKQVDHQNAELADIQSSLDEVTEIERQIVPLMVRMIDSLDQFIKLDVPFLPEEPATRVKRLRETIERSDVTTAEKFRSVLEAYQIENDFGRTIESYEGDVEIAGGTRQVDFLRIGRVALLYQTPDGEFTGAWDKQQSAWIEIPPSTYKQQVRKGIRIARKQIAPDLMILPMPAAEEVKS